MKKIVLTLVLAASFVACNSEDPTVAPAASRDLLKASSLIDYVNDADFKSTVEIASLLAGRSENNAASTPSCATVTSSGTDYPQTYILDFGDGCTHNNITRSGILTITLSGPVLDAGSQITMERSNYYINGYHVEGTVVYINETTGEIPQWTRSISTGTVTAPDGNVYTHSGTHTVQLTAGADTTSDATDNVYQVISGSHNVSDTAGDTLTATVIEPLVRMYSCEHASDGILGLSGTVYNGQLDYGDGECDAVATYTNSEGVTSTVQL
jgi:hypothetical protein